MKERIGIPKAFLYYRYHILWKNFFKSLGYRIVESDNTTRETIELGKKYSIDEACLSSKIYIGHVYNLINKCDYILVPRIGNYGKNEKVCVKFNANYDIVKNLFPSQKILEYNIERTKHKSEFISLSILGLKLNKNIFKVISSYIVAKHKQTNYEKRLILKQEKLLQSPKSKILVIAHPYNTYDNYIGTPIIKKIKDLGMEVLYADRINKKVAKKYGQKLSPTLYWTYSKELIGSISYYKDKVDGIIFITSFPCGPDSLVNELIMRKIDNTPILNLIVDELTGESGLETRLESFADIINERRDNVE